MLHRLQQAHVALSLDQVAPVGAMAESLGSATLTASRVALLPACTARWASTVSVLQPIGAWDFGLMTDPLLAAKVAAMRMPRTAADATPENRELCLRSAADEEGESCLEQRQFALAARCRSHSSPRLFLLPA